MSAGDCPAPLRDRLAPGFPERRAWPTGRLDRWRRLALAPRAECRGPALIQRKLGTVIPPERLPV